MVGQTTLDRADEMREAGEIVEGRVEHSCTDELAGMKMVKFHTDDTSSDGRAGNVSVCVLPCEHPMQCMTSSLLQH